MPIPNKRTDNHFAEPPEKLTGREFEDVCLMDVQHHQKQKKPAFIFSRYGIQSATIFEQNGKSFTRPIKSLPDFEGVLAPDGIQFIFDCKVCSQASFGSNEFRKFLDGRQFKHLLKRSDFGAICFLLIHWNARSLKKKKIEAATYAMPILATVKFWDDVSNGVELSLSRDLCAEYGIACHWWVPNGCKVARPDFSKLLVGLVERWKEDET